MVHPNQNNWRYKLIGLSRWIERRSAILIVLLGVTAFISAFAGVAVHRSQEVEPTDAKYGKVQSPESQEKEVAQPSNESSQVAVAPNRLWTTIDWFTDSLYEAVQVLLLNMSPYNEKENPANLAIMVARIASVLFFALVAIQAIRKLFNDSFSELLIWFRRKNLVLVVGLGRLGWAIAQEQNDLGRLVVAQEIDEKNPHRSLAAELGIIVRTEDCTDLQSMREHLLLQPRTIHLVAGEDLTNINALANIRRIRQDYVVQTGKSLAPVDCFVQIERPNLHSSFYRCLLDAEAQTDEGMNVRVFNMNHETACQLIIDDLTPLRPRNSDQVALYFVFGLEQMGIALLRELVEFAHFENLKRSRIVIVGTDAQQDYQRCVAVWPRLCTREIHSQFTDVHFDPVRDNWGSQEAKPEIDFARTVASKAVQYAANVQFTQLRTPRHLSQSELEHIVKLSREPGVCPVVLFCYEDDADNFRLASELEDLLQDRFGMNRGNDVTTPHAHLPIFAYLPKSGPLREVLSQAVAANPMSVHPFGAVEQGLLRAHDNLVDEIALDLAYDYHLNSSPHVSREQFKDLFLARPYWDQISNMNAAEHKQILVQILGYRMSRSGQKQEQHAELMQLSAIPKKQLLRVAKVEHNRWMAERLMLGWSYGPRQNHPPQRESLCVEKYLSEEDWQKDVQQIKRSLTLFEQRKVQFVRSRP